jgi:hypothetical protein
LITDIEHNFFHPYAYRTFELFFKRQLNLENIDEITKLLYETSNENVSFEKFSPQRMKLI